MNNKEQIYDPASLRWNPSATGRIHQLPEIDRPREKLAAKGAGALSDVELLAVLLGSGTRKSTVLDLSTRILRAVEGHLERADLSILRTLPGVGEAKACQIIASLELARRHLTRNRTTLREAVDALPFLQEFRNKKQEHFVCLSLSGAREVIERRVVTVGLLDTNQVHPREVFADPIVDRAAAILVAHNHPSGTLAASPEDIALTRRLAQAGQLLGIRLLDHIIVCREGHLSMKSEGLMS